MGAYTGGVQAKSMFFESLLVRKKMTSPSSFGKKTKKNACFFHSPTSPMNFRAQFFVSFC